MFTKLGMSDMLVNVISYSKKLQNDWWDWVFQNRVSSVSLWKEYCPYNCTRFTVR
jgi:hypothetical protein